MVEFTVGVASACIAAGIAAMQFALPNALALILTRRLSEEESHSAVTWSVVSRFILSSHWPLILRSDAAASKSVVRSVSLLTWIRPLGFLLIAIAAIVTPLSLYETFAASSRTTNVQFIYVRKDDAFGKATTPRHAFLGPSRLCGYEQLCPGMPYLGNATLVTYDDQTQSVPIKTPALLQETIDLFESGRSGLGPAVAGPFDIQFRYFITRNRSDIANNASYIVNSFNRFASLLLKQDYSLIEGLDVDPVAGGVGFRNHSVPSDVLYAAEWEEDILFMEPDAVCVNLNVTVAYEIPLNRIGEQHERAYEMWSLVNRGGFVNLPKTPPFPNTNESYPFSDGKRNPQLFRRAYNAAWAVNYYTMLSMNLTFQNSSMAPVFSSMDQQIPTEYAPYSLNPLQDSATYVSKMQVERTLASGFGYALWYDDTIDLARGPTSGGLPELGNIAVDVAAVILAAHQSHDLPKGVGEGNTTLERPVHVCATATKLTIKTVKFSYNSTGGDNSIEGLKVVKVGPRRRAVGDEELIWGQETPVPAVILLRDRIGWYFSPLWGFLDEATTRQPNVSSYSGDTFYVPASKQSADGSSDMYGLDMDNDNIAATVGPLAVWTQALHEFSTTHDFYTGQGDLPLTNVWRARSSDETGVATILKLMWTDLAANALVGMRGLHTVDRNVSAKIKRRNLTDGDLAAGYPVHLTTRQLRYK